MKAYFSPETTTICLRKFYFLHIRFTKYFARFCVLHIFLNWQLFRVIGKTPLTSYTLIHEMLLLTNFIFRYIGIWNGRNIYRSHRLFPVCGLHNASAWMKFVSNVVFDILRRFRDAVTRKLLIKWRTNSWFLLHDNAAIHLSVLVNDFLTKNKVTTLQHTTFSPELDPAEFYRFFWQKLALQGRRFCDATYIFKNAVERLKRLQQNGFQRCFQHTYSWWQNCIVVKRNFFKEM